MGGRTKLLQTHLTTIFNTLPVCILLEFLYDTHQTIKHYILMNVGYLLFVQIVSKSPPPLPPPRTSRSSELIINISRLIKHLIDHPSACVTHNTPLQYFPSYWRLELASNLRKISQCQATRAFSMLKATSVSTFLTLLCYMGTLTVNMVLKAK